VMESLKVCHPLFLRVKRKSGVIGKQQRGEKSGWKNAGEKVNRRAKALAKYNYKGATTVD
jgi:hypothetical protein